MEVTDIIVEFFPCRGYRAAVDLNHVKNSAAKYGDLTTVINDDYKYCCNSQYY
jgi:hypothetical protein